MSTILGVPARLRALREGVGRKPLLAALGMKRAQWDRYESGKHLPQPDQIERIARVAQQPPIWVLTGQSDGVSDEAQALQAQFDMNAEETSIIFPLIRSLLTLLRNGTPGRIAKQAKIGRFRLYDLRHTYACLRLADGAPPTYVAAQLGHATPATTFRHYARWIPSAGRQWVEKDAYRRGHGRGKRKGLRLVSR